MLKRDWVNAFVLALVLVGMLLALFGTYRYVDASRRLGDNIAHQIRSSGEQIDPQTTAEARGLVAADVERRRLIGQRNDALLMGGAGLVTLAVGWIAYDYLRNRRERDEQATTSPPAGSATS